MFLTTEKTKQNTRDLDCKCNAAWLDVKTITKHVMYNADLAAKLLDTTDNL